MKRIWICLGLWLLLPDCLHAQGITGTIGALAWMNGGASATMQDVWSVENNPAAISMVPHSVGGVYTEQRFNQSSNRLTTFSILKPAQWLSAGLSFRQYGNQVFHQQKGTLALGRQLTSRFALGIQLHYLSTFMMDYGRTHSLVGGLGLLAKLTSSTQVGLVIFNPEQTRFDLTSGEQIPAFARLGLGHFLSQELLIQLEAEQSLNRPMILRGGIRYDVHPAVKLAMGASSNPFYYTFGISFGYRQFRIDIASSIHEILGPTPHLSFSAPIASRK